MTEDRVGPGDIQRAGYCISGAKAWFERHDLDFRDFIINGIEVSKLPEDDAIVRHVLKVRARHG